MLRDDEGRLLVRLFDPSGSPSEARLRGRTGHRVDLRGAELGPFTGDLVLDPWEIATLRVDDPA